jgi:hypothetical protein
MRGPREAALEYGARLLVRKAGTIRRKERAMAGDVRRFMMNVSALWRRSPHISLFFGRVDAWRV